MARENNLDAVRLGAAILVIIGHAYLLSGGDAPGFGGRPIHTLGVCIFFALSGYLIATSWLRDPDMWRFLTRRVLRILPALAVVVLVTALLLGPVVTDMPARDYFRSPDFFRYFLNLVLYVRLGLPGVFDGTPHANVVNGSLWTLPVEFSLYLLLPSLIALAWVWRVRNTPLPFLLVATAACAWLQLRFLHSGQRPPELVILGTEFWAAFDLAPYFLIGACLAVAKAERLLHPLMAPAVLLAVLVLGRDATSQEALLLFAVPVATLSIGLARMPVAHRAGRWGDLSYGLYLWSFPVQQLLLDRFSVSGAGWDDLLLVFAISATLAFASWHLVEKQFLSFKPRRAAPQPVAVAAED
ncbi:acyltransferase [Roseomonas terrae]|uniref:Acyltransferase n=1 Tax=Neoroseomonas terrae TaxID=424799 RepID=A0ABS5EIH7_9PROT|nr:acyltransferase [Neoroseomonas terrae]MBR0650806.1 acyltransferase [Neoroseomonas terrae]